MLFMSLKPHKTCHKYTSVKSQKTELETTIFSQDPDTLCLRPQTAAENPPESPNVNASRHIRF
jgi:hypothetical protein